jgi:hypothetical protein
MYAAMNETFHPLGDVLGMPLCYAGVGEEYISVAGRTDDAPVVMGDGSVEDSWKTTLRQRAISIRRILSRHPWAIGFM